MQQTLKILLITALVALGLSRAGAYSLLGPVGGGGDAYQVTAIGYNPLPGLGPPFIIDGLPTGPKNISQGYRRNVGTLYYACDASFLGFFGSNGVSAVQQSFNILNALTNVDTYSPDLSEFPLNTMDENYSLNAVNLFDLKSMILELMVEQMGIADSVRYTYALHNRFQPSGTKCPVGTEYAVVMRNFDILTSPLTAVQYSPYVNGTLYHYYIYEDCGAAGASPPDADALETPADQLTYNPPVSSEVESLQLGYFYTGLTRDDVAALRYLISSNNVHMENPAAGSVLISTNFGTTTTLTSSDFNTLWVQSQTNDPVAVLPTLFPNVIVANYTNYWTNVCTPNLVTYFTNYPGEPAGSQTLSVTTTNGYTCGPQEIFAVTYANVYTNANFTNTPSAIMRDSNKLVLHYSTNTVVTKVKISLSEQVGAPAGSPPITNYTSTRIVLNQPSGEYLTLPVTQCGWEILSVLSTNVVKTTNVVTSATNNTGFLAETMYISKFTNHTFIVRAVTCDETTPGPGLYQGIQKVNFRQANFDSLVGQFFEPITNDYYVGYITNSTLTKRHFRRVITAPDFLLTGTDFAPGPSSGPAMIQTPVSRSILFDQSTVNNGQAGPGVINSPTTFTFDEVGNVLFNVGTSFLNDNNAMNLGWIWGSFDETTNAPTVYPNGTSIQNLMNQIIINVSPAGPVLASGAVNTAYPGVTFTATGGTSPYAWSLASGSPGLPPGLQLSAGGAITGTPTQAGIYDFIVQMTDADNRSITGSYSITVN